MRVPSLEARYADHLEAVHQGGLGGVLLGHGQVANPRGSQAARHRQHAGHRAHRAVEGQLADEPVAVDPERTVAEAEDGQRDAEVACALFTLLGYARPVRVLFGSRPPS
jgi:hypothetical protein